jgi:glyoxylase-like metal-dependent hydrolase (beta-lactamase superfamily II)
VKLISVSKNVIQLTRLRFVNAFLVREEDGFTLVDTTTAGAADALITAGERGGGPIRRIALAHGHGDHVGALDALAERLGASVRVLMPGTRRADSCGRADRGWEAARCVAEAQECAGRAAERW